MSEKKRNILSAAMKAKIALEAAAGHKTINEIAQKHSVHPTQINLWKKELVAKASQLFEGKRSAKPVDESLDPHRLYAKIGQLNMELDWLKKKSGITP